MTRVARLLAGVVVLVMMSVLAYSASMTVSITPNPGTSNSVYIIEAVWTDATTTGYMIPTPGGAPSGMGMVVLYGLGSVANGSVWGGIPMYHVQGSLNTGATYRAVVSGGLNLANTLQQADRRVGGVYSYMPILGTYPLSTNGSDYRVTRSSTTDATNTPSNLVPYADWNNYPIWYSQNLNGGWGIYNGNNSNTFQCYVEAWAWDPSKGEISGTTTIRVDFTVTSYSSSGYTYDPTGSHSLLAMNYGWAGWSDSYRMWVPGDMDYLTCYPDNWGNDTTDPLTVIPTEYANDMTPDEGSGNAQYDFRIKYNNLANLPPVPWMQWPDYDESGVVLYFGRIDADDYDAYPMSLESGAAVGGVYKFSFLPAAESDFWLGNRRTKCYSTLEPGIYHYFFGTSDDSLMSVPSWEDVWQHKFALSKQPIMSQWGGFSYGNHMSGANTWNPLDPRGARKITGYSAVDRLSGRRYSSGRLDPYNTTQTLRYDDTLFVDRVIRAPGVFEDDQTWGFLATPKYTRQYPFPCNEYPKVTCLIDMRNPSSFLYQDDDGLEFNDKKYGYSRYWGTLQPFKRGVFPILQGDAAGATTTTENIFRIVYRQMDGKTPIKSQVLISNGMGRTGSKAYSMVPDDVLNGKAASDLTTQNYKDGVWYTTKLKLPAGPHSYYYTFSDGLQTANWPTRPDFDQWVYGSGLANDCVPGPYINSPAVLSSGAVTPGSGKQGTTFKYTVTYKDADGQRPFKGYVYIETASGKVRQCEMQPVDKANLTDTNIKGTGVQYYFDTASVQDIVMESGLRRFYFEFSDDWGDPSNINDRIEGEKTRFPSATDSWMQGPEVVANVAPRLTNGSVNSVDGSATPGTVWSFEVTYADINNDTPTSLKLYIGQLQRDEKTVIWDEGHAMLEKDSTDTIYNDGKDYYFQTRLGGVDQSNDVDKQYYYAFYASDGELIATYKSSSDAAIRSDAATAFYRQELLKEPVGGDIPVADQYFSFKDEKIAQRATVTGPYSALLSDPTDILTIAGVYTTEDLGGVAENLYLDNSDNPGSFVVTEQPVGTFTGIVTTKDNLPEIGSTVWIEYLTKSPIVGPVNIDQPAPAGVLADAEIYAGTTPNDASANRLRLDGQKSGWNGESDGIISDLDVPRFAVMRGVCTDLAGSPSDATVAPEFPDMIASIEGVYLLPTVDGDDPFVGTNYYDPTLGPHFQAGDKLIPLKPMVGGASIAGKSVLIKYCDMRFTYIQRGVGQNTTPSPVDGSYTSYYIPDAGYNAYIKDNKGTDKTAGLVGVWLNPQRELSNYFDPWLTPYDAVRPGIADRVLLTGELPAGSGNVYGRYYQSGQYHIDRWNRRVYSLTALSANMYATYMFGRRMPVTVKRNTSPELTGGNVSTYRGSRTTVFVYSVTYSDIDGPNGQQPSFVKVYIDGVSHDMTRESVGTPDYRQGARYLYSTTVTTAGSHTFHFEASDGTAFAVYDWYNANNETRPASGQRVREIDGPWINDPPKLSNVIMNPTPTARLGQVVDVSVDYTDADNDEPYFFDAKKDIKDDGTPLGLAMSRSPRLWIGPSTDPTTVYVEGTITSIDNVDKRILNITLDSEYTVTDDSLQDYYLQIIPKDQQDYAGRLYLVTTNTSTSLQVRTKDAESDGVVAGDRFRVNGILMRKTDAADRNYTDGCNYTTTLPTLPAGKFKMQISARSREDKPAWLKTAMTGNGEQWLPYSDPAAETTIGNLTELVLQRPSGNTPPILTGTVGTTIAQGQNVKGTKIALQHTAEVLSATKVSLWDPDNEPYNRLFVTNVFRYADSMYRDAVNRRDLDGYFSATIPARNYDLIAGTSAGATASTEITLSKAFLPISVATELVQSAIVDEFGLFAVPDSAAAIGTVLGVYSDPEGLNRIDDPLVSQDSLGRVKLDKTKLSLVSDDLKMNAEGSKIAFLKYNPAIVTFKDDLHPIVKSVPVTFSSNQITPVDVNVAPSMAGVIGVYLASDTTMTGTNYYDSTYPFAPGNASVRVTSNPGTEVNIKYIAFPPVYVEFRGGHVEGTVDSKRLLASGVPVVLGCEYRDADSDPPSFHDNVDGFLMVDIFNDTHLAKGYYFSMPSPEPQNFTSNVRFERVFDSGSLADVLVEGLSTFSFVGNDGYAASTDYVWMPAKRPNGFKLYVNKLPVLKDAVVLSLGRTGSGGMNFTVSVNYSDADGQAPSFILGRVKFPDGHVEDTTLNPTAGTPNYKTGVVYTGNITLDSDSSPAEVVFEASDGIQRVVPLDSKGKPAVPIEVVVNSTNTPPIVTAYSLDKASGKTDTSFLFSATYRDIDGDSPLVTVNNVAQEGIWLLVTETNSKNTAKFVLKRTGTSKDYRSLIGVAFTASIKGSEIMAAIGDKKVKLGWSGKTNYTYTVAANDGIANASIPTPLSKSGPVLNIPYIKTLAAVDKDSGVALTRAAAGREVLLQGKIAFPSDGTTSAPAVADMRLIVSIPGGASIGIPVNISNLKLVTGTYKKEWIGDISPGYAYAEPNQDPAVASGNSIKLTTGGDWKFRINWSGSTIWDTLIFDANLDGTNDSPDDVALSVGGPLRTVAVLDPGQPVTSKPLIDMLTPPMYIGNPNTADAGFVFGYEHAIDMQVVRWDPSSRTYKSYTISSPLELAPGEAVWAKPKDKYPSASISASDIESGLLMSGNIGITLDPANQYRLISVNAKDYPVDTDSTGKTIIDAVTGKVRTQACTIALKNGWNQFGNIFYNWKTVSGVIAVPRVDNGIALSSVSVTYLGVTKTLADARTAGWIRDYAWRYDAETGKYVLVSPTVVGAERVLHVWSGYWIRALVDCDLVIDPNAVGINAASKVTKTQKVGVFSIGTDGSGNSINLDVPPAPAFGE